MAGKLRLGCTDNYWRIDGRGKWQRALYGTDFGLGGSRCLHALVYVKPLVEPEYILMLYRNLAYQFIIGLPLSTTLLPIAAPTLYLWIVDTLALRRGTWVIESGTKLEWHIWDGLEAEYERLYTPLSSRANNRVEKLSFSS